MSAAVGHGPYALGYQTAFDTGKSALTKHNLALNYNAGDMVMHGSLADFKVRSFYCRVSCIKIIHQDDEFK